MTSYRLKRISFHGREVPIVLQNENGPCPLLAIANILLLRGAITLSANAPDVSLERLMQMVAEYLLDNNKVEEGTPLAANQQKNLDDVISALPKLSTGVDVNPKFDSIRGFEFTNEVAIFDLFSVSLVHGWLADPSAPDLASYTYNQLVGELVAIMGDETPAHLLTPQSSFASRGGQGSKELTARLSTSEQDEPNLIQLDENEVRGTEAEAEAGLGPIPEQGAASSSPEGGENPGDLLSGTPAAGVEDVTVQMVGSDPVRQETGSENGNPPQGEPDPPKEKAGGSQESLEAREKRIKDKAFSRRVQDWLEDTSSQLTYHGLASLHEGLKDEQLAVFFRNNHFNTILKQGRGLYLLVTDQGYMSESGVVWEKLDAVDGDTQLVNHEFVPYTKTEQPAVPSHDVELQQALAASLEMTNNGGGGADPTSEQGRASEGDHGLPEDFLVLHPSPPPRPMGGVDADLALAMQLQEEELEAERQAVAAREARARQTQNQQQLAPHQRQGPRPARGNHDPRSGNRWTQSPSQGEEQQLTGFQKFQQGFKKLFTSKKE
ncbi:hypothetical protein BSKO_05438 [Bryopsis sp. KO-2023]|nr:hypothetical protein BSKO_05438 [Bryopsis sp. KO-2023]